MRSLATFAAALFLSAPAFAGSHPVLVELFTSQGCSSCPPADAFMQDLVKQDGVVALTLPVDIWDYLGWKDTFAKHEFAVRQQAYAPNLPSKSVYTPQMVIGGMADVVGSRRDDAEEIIKAQAAKDAPAAGITLTIEGDTLQVAVAPSQELLGADATVYLARVVSSKAVEIGDGENKGKTITYSNVVRELSPIGMWHGDEAKLEAPVKADIGEAYDRLAVFIQRGEQGPIVGAALIDIPQTVSSGTP